MSKVLGLSGLIDVRVFADEVARRKAISYLRVAGRDHGIENGRIRFSRSTNGLTIAVELIGAVA